MILRKLLSSLAISGLMAAGALAQATTAPTTRTLSLPLIGLASSETAQINVTNLAGASPTGTAASCTGTISFVNSNAATIGTSTPFTISSGQISSASLPFSKSGGTGVHTVIRGALTLTETTGVPCELEATLEVYDTNTGVTHTSQTSLGPSGGGPGFGR